MVGKMRGTVVGGRRHATAIMMASAVVFALIAVSRPATAALYVKDVKCGDTVLGKMEIDTYQVGETGDGTVDNPYRGFVEIDGQFVAAPAGAGHSFHYIQAIVNDDRPPAFTDGTANTTPYIDTPPGGYQSGAFDFKPYYDEGNEFPDFFDKPTINLAFTANQGDKARELEFETWLVCVIEETLGGTANNASDDTYKVAPLLGWKWGFDQTYAAVAPDGDGLEDISQVIVAFDWLATPSASWTAALAKVYGTNPNQDNFNVTVGDCEDCAVVPEPAGVAVMLFCMVMVPVVRRLGPTLLRET